MKASNLNLRVTVMVILLIVTSLAGFLSHPAMAATPTSTPQVEPIDYSRLSHDLDVSMLRAGAHNGSQPSSYIFKVTAHASANSADERAKDLANRKKITVELGNFGESQLEPLAIWRTDAKAKQFKQIHIDGKVIRELVARAMTELQIAETEVTIQTDVSLIAKKKKYYLLNDDQVVATVSFSPLLQVADDSQLADRQFTMVDDKGAVAKFTLHYNATLPAKDSEKK